MDVRLRGPLKLVALVGIGGFAGANLRYAVSLLAPGLAGTLAVNAVGSLALGFLVSEAAGEHALSAEARTLLTTGFISSLTTYSTFAVETAGVSPPLMLANVTANYALGCFAVVVGRALAVRSGGDS